MTTSDLDFFSDFEDFGTGMCASKCPSSASLKGTAGWTADGVAASLSGTKKYMEIGHPNSRIYQELPVASGTKTFFFQASVRSKIENAAGGFPYIYIEETDSNGLVSQVLGGGLSTTR